MADHRIRYKNTGLDAKELRRRREEDSIQLRKQKRNDVLSKRRTIAPPEETRDESFDQICDDTVTKTEACDTLTPDMIEGIMQDTDLPRILDCAQKVRRLLSREPAPPFDEVIGNGMVPRLIKLLDLYEDPMIQFEVAWILTNICSGTTEQTKVVVDNGALPKLVNLVRSEDLRVCEQAIWALGNIIGDGAGFRDLVIAHGMVPELLKLLSEKALEVGFRRNATWVLVNLCRNKDPPVDLSVCKQIVPALITLIESDDQTIFVDATWAISYITELGPDYSQLIIDSGLVNKMSKLVSNGEQKIQMAAIRALGCIATGDDHQTQVVIDSGAITHLRHALDTNNDRIAKDALWFLSNVLAGSQSQIQAIVDEGLVPLIIHFLARGDYPQQKEASWAIYNFCLVGRPEQLQVLVQHDVVTALCDLLTLKDTTLVHNVLEALKYLLSKVENDQQVRFAIEKCGGLDKIEALQSSTNQEVYAAAYKIIDQYFNDNDDAENVF